MDHFCNQKASVAKSTIQKVKTNPKDSQVRQSRKMKSFIGGLILVAMTAQLVASAEIVEEKIKACLRQADTNADNIYVEPQFKDFCNSQVVIALPDKFRTYFFDECKRIYEETHFALVETDCSYDLEKYVGKHPDTPKRFTEKLNEVLEYTKYCHESRVALGPFGNVYNGGFDSDWYQEVFGSA